MDRFLELTKRHKVQMDSKNILICIYTNASGFLWSLMKVDSGTDLGYSEYRGNDNLGAFNSYENALEDALTLVEKCDLVKFKNENKSNFHWGNYANWLFGNYDYVIS